MSCIEPCFQIIYRCFKKKENTYQPMINMSISGCENIYISSDNDNTLHPVENSDSTNYVNRMIQIDKTNNNINK